MDLKIKVDHYLCRYGHITTTPYLVRELGISTCSECVKNMHPMANMMTLKEVYKIPEE